MDYKKVKVHNSIYEVVQPNQFNPEMFSYGEVAIQHNGMVYPYENPRTYNGPVVNTENSIIMFDSGQYGNREINYDPNVYSANNIIDFGQANNIGEMINASQSIRKLEDEILISTDNIYNLKIRESDSPEMAGLKEAINSKQIDIERYKSRFNGNYGNDKRWLENSPSVTFPKLSTFMEIFDFKGTLILEDKSEDVPNPMNKKIVIELE